MKASLLLRHSRKRDEPEVSIRPPVADVKIENIGERLHRGDVLDDLEYLLFNNRVTTSDPKSFLHIRKPASVDMRNSLLSAMDWTDHERGKVLSMLSKEEYTVKVNKDMEVQVRVRSLCLSSYICPDKSFRHCIVGSNIPETQKLFRFANRPCVLVLHDLGDERSSWLQWMRLAVDIFKGDIFDIVMLEVDQWRKDPSSWFSYLPYILPHLLEHLGISKVHILADGYGSGCFLRWLTQWKNNDNMRALGMFSKTTHLLHNCDFHRAIHLYDDEWAKALRAVIKATGVQLWFTWQDQTHPFKVARNRSSGRSTMKRVQESITQLAADLESDKCLLDPPFDPTISSELPSSVLRSELIDFPTGRVAMPNLVNLPASERFTESVKEFFREGERAKMRLIKECFLDGLFIDSDVLMTINRPMIEVPQGGGIFPALLSGDERKMCSTPNCTTSVRREEGKDVRILNNNREIESVVDGPIAEGSELKVLTHSFTAENPTISREGVKKTTVEYEKLDRAISKSLAERSISSILHDGNS